jgi:potassium efflux system protein
MHKTFLLLTLGLLLGVFSFVRVEGQAAAASGASTNAPAATPTVQPIPLSNVVTEAVSAAGKLGDMQASLASDQTTAVADQTLPGLTTEIDQRQRDDARLLASTPTLPNLRAAQASWGTLSGSLGATKQSLASRVSELDAQVTQLASLSAKWQATATLAGTSAAPPDVIGRIQGIVTSIAATKKATEDLRARILSSQYRLGDQETRIKAGLDEVEKAKASAVGLLFTRDSVPVWDLGRQAAEPGPANASGKVSFAAQVQALTVYLAQKIPTVCIHFLVFLLLAVALIWIRRELHAGAGEDPAVKNAAHVLEVPLATAAVLALLASFWFYPAAPRLLSAGLGAAALIPSVLILRRLIGRALLPILWAMVVSYFVDQVRSVFMDTPLASRFLFLSELVAATIFLAGLLRSRHAPAAQGQEALLERVVRIYARMAFAIFGLAVLANVLGYTHLSYLAGNAMLESSYLAVILYAAVRIGDGLIITVLKIRPLSSFGMVQRHEPMLAARASLTIRWLAALFWVWMALELFSARSVLAAGIWAVLTYAIPYGSIHLSLMPLLLFGLTIWVSLLISRFVRFVLAEEVYPHLALGPGVPYATSTMAHYVILTFGTLFALAAIKVDLSKYAVLAGALGVGLGFGLQNIMNNFVSGIILLFERPIKVGDVVQVDTSVGTVERIGIRASVIRITNGSEVIMPNGNLISNPVTNWTFSDRKRVIDISLAIAAKADPQKVIALLVATAKADPAVLSEPPPQVLFTNLTGATLNFELRAWTSKHETWQQVRSDLYLALSAALARENIAMS